MILQTRPPTVLRLHARSPLSWALLAGWAAGMIPGNLIANAHDPRGSVFERFGIRAEPAAAVPA